MKSFSVIVFAVLFACGADKESMTNNSILAGITNVSEVKYQFESFQKRYNLLDSAELSVCDVRFSVVRITGGLPLSVTKKVTEAIEVAFFSETNGGILLKEKMQIEAEKIRMEYAQLGKELSRSKHDIDPKLHNWKFDYRVEFVAQDDRFLTFQVEKKKIVSTDHPRNTRQYFLMDLKTQEVVALSSYLPKDKKAELRNKIVEKLRTNYENEQEFESNIWVDRVQVTSNFYIHENIVVFYYNPYEIAPYEYGPTEISFGVDELEGILTL